MPLDPPTPPVKKLETYLQEGDLFMLKPGDRVCTLVTKREAYSGDRYAVADPAGDTLVDAGITLTPGKNGIHDYILREDFVVYKTTYDGGGSDHGHDGAYPNGHHVWAEALDNPEIRIDFYESGSFTNLCRPAVIRKMERRWVPLGTPRGIV